jgi:membrane-associated phospholipid phosphatase
MKIPFLFLTLTLVFWIIGFGWYLSAGDKEILFFINHHYSFSLDVLHATFSFFGRGDTLFAIVLLSFIYKPLRHKIYLFYASLYGIIASLVVGSLKMYFDIDRPLLAYPNQVRKVLWLSQAFEYSFPSGHTFGAFSFFSFMMTAFGLQQKWLQCIVFILCLGCGISRIYLGQHVMSDVLFGAALGTLIGYIFGIFAQKSFVKHQIYLPIFNYPK